MPEPFSTNDWRYLVEWDVTNNSFEGRRYDQGRQNIKRNWRNNSLSMPLTILWRVYSRQKSIEWLTGPKLERDTRRWKGMKLWARSYVWLMFKYVAEIWWMYYFFFKKCRKLILLRIAWGNPPLAAQSMKWVSWNDPAQSWLNTMSRENFLCNGFAVN